MASPARWISILAHPFVMIPVMIVAGSLHLGVQSEIVESLGLAGLFLILPVAVLTVVQVSRGAWKNVDASNPCERPILYAVGLAGLLALAGYLAASRTHPFLLRGCLVSLAMLAACAIITRWIKVSLHVATAALTATALVLIGSPAGWALAAVVPILAWSRLALGRHRLPELALGIFFGVLAGVTIYLLWR